MLVKKSNYSLKYKPKGKSFTIKEAQSSNMAQGDKANKGSEQ